MTATSQPPKVSILKNRFDFGAAGGDGRRLQLRDRFGAAAPVCQPGPADLGEGPGDPPEETT